MSDVVLPCATCGAETSAALAGEIAYVEPPAGPTSWLCPACSARLPVALDYIAESRGGGDPHSEYVERLESALMAGWFELLMTWCGRSEALAEELSRRERLVRRMAEMMSEPPVIQTNDAKMRELLRSGFERAERQMLRPELRPDDE